VLGVRPVLYLLALFLQFLKLSPYVVQCGDWTRAWVSASDGASAHGDTIIGEGQRKAKIIEVQNPKGARARVLNGREGL
jgi:hypothetical protein